MVNLELLHGHASNQIWKGAEGEDCDEIALVLDDLKPQTYQK